MKIREWLVHDDVVPHRGKSKTMEIGTKYAIGKASELDVFLQDHRLKGASS